ncbi:hypothetical protein WJX74_009105 [Apatococcus lobatus]|uniref:Uncharacterized protein n=1 Tax=Apatococcus lobatus TaxID=904363 RepID=A0AAW1QNI0_9CHLO
MAQLPELIQGSYRSPAAVAEGFRRQGQQAGFSTAGSFCWTTVRSTLKLWRYKEGPLAQISSRHFAESARSVCFVEICEPLETTDLVVILVTYEGLVTLWRSFGHLELDPLVHHLQSPVAAASVCCYGNLSSWQAAVALESSAILLLKPAWQQSAMQTIAIGSLVKGNEGSGVFGRLRAYNPIRWQTGSKPAGAVVALRLFQADALAAEPVLLALTSEHLSLWQVDGAEGPSEIWKLPILTMLQQRMSQANIALHDVRIAPGAPLLAPPQPSSLQTSGPHAFTARTDPTAVLLASQPEQAASAARPSSAGPAVGAHTAILTSLVLQRQGIEVQASSEVSGRAWGCSIEAGVANPQQRLQSAPGIGADSVLLWQRQGPAVLWSLGAGAKDLEGASDCLAAVAPAANAGSWAILTPSQGVQEYGRPAAAPQPESMMSDDEDIGLSPEQPSPAMQTAMLLDSRPGQDAGMSSPPALPDTAFRLLDDACLSSTRGGSGVMPGLLPELQGIGCFHIDGPSNPIALYSTRLVDMLPKHWGGAATGPALSRHLQNKRAAHSRLLGLISQAGISSRLPASALNLTLEAGQLLAAVAAVREAESLAQQTGERREQGAGLLPDLEANAELLGHAIDLAGQSVQQKLGSMAGHRGAWEVFYSCPAASAPEFFNALASLVPSNDGAASGNSLAHRLGQLRTLASIAQTVTDAAGQHKALQLRQLPAATRAGGGWLSGEAVRGCFTSILHAFQELRPLVYQEAPGEVLKLVESQVNVTAQLLSSLAAAMAGAETEGSNALLVPLEQEHRKERQASLQDLFEQAQILHEQGGPHGMQLLQEVERLAAYHDSYPQLWSICDWLGDAAKLHDHMAASARPTILEGYGSVASMADFAFDRLIEEQRGYELLTMPDTFNEALSDWFQQDVPNLQEQSSSSSLARQKAELRPLHQLRLGQFFPAATGFQTLADSHETQCGCATRLTCCSQLASLASVADSLAPAPAPVQEHIQATIASLHLQAAQEEMGLGEELRQAPETLMTAALQGSAAQALLVFKILLAAGAAFSRQHRVDFEAVWRKAVEATDWDNLSRQRKGLSELQLQQRFTSTLLYQAAHACYSAESRMLAKQPGSQWFLEIFPHEKLHQTLREWAVAFPSPNAGDLILQVFQAGIQA